MFPKQNNADESGVWFQNTIETSIETSADQALSELIGDWQLQEDTNSANDCQLLVFLFLSEHWKLEEVTSNAMDLLEEAVGESQKDKIQLITVIGGGVIGQHAEHEAETSHPVYRNKPQHKQMSILGGYCKKQDETASDQNKPLEVFSMSNNDASGKTTSQGTNPQFQPDSSLFVFSDPYCRHLDNLFEELHALQCQVAGGVSVPPKNALHDPTLAMNRKSLPKGSLVGVQLPSNYQLQCVVSQGGCRPVGPTYRVTSVDGPAIHELNEVTALEQLQSLCGDSNNSDDENYDALSPKDQELIRQGGVLAGVFLEASSNVDDQLKEDESRSLQPTAMESSQESSNGNEDVGLEGEYMVREVTGFRPRSGSILVCGQPQVEEGDLFRFHVRSSQEAVDDWKLLLEQTKMEQLFLSSEVDNAAMDLTQDDRTTSSRIVCGMQISSLARGKDFFEAPNVDLDHAKMLLESKRKRGTTPPIGGFFSNAEIGPVGIRMGAQGDSSQPYLHGFATVVAMLCEITPKSDKGNSQGDGSKDNFQPTVSSSQWA